LKYSVPLTRPADTALGEGTILFGGSGYLGPYILQAYPKIVSVGRSAPPTDNVHIQVDSLEDLDVLKDVSFDRVIYIIGNTDHHNIAAETVLNQEVHPLLLGADL
jgi:hypothetical protein